jgi:hypothetical protein
MGGRSIANKTASYSLRRQDYCGSANVVLLSHSLHSTSSEGGPIGNLPHKQ